MGAENLYLKIIDNLFDGVYFVSKERRITFWNKAAEEITGYTATEMIGQCCQNNYLNHMDVDGRLLCNLGCPLFATIIDGKPRSDEVFLQHKDGHRVTVGVNIFPYLEENEIVGAIEIFTPIASITHFDTASKARELSFKKKNNCCTSVEEVESYLVYKLHELRRTQRTFCLLMLNVDDFNSFNTQYGYEIGNQMLNRVYRSICFNIRPTDFFGFWSDRELVGVFEIKRHYEATLLAEKIRILVAGSQLPHESGNLSVTASFGVTVAHENDTVTTITQRARDLLTQSKERRKNCISSDA